MDDIKTRADIHRIIHDFYTKLMEDKEVGELFHSEVGSRLEKHLDTIIDFWVFNVLQEGSYKNNMFAAHLGIHDRWNLDQRKFDIWLAYFNNTIDDHFSGEKAERMKINASGIAAVMISKLQGNGFFNLRN
jgi:hemoglobin